MKLLTNQEITELSALDPELATKIQAATEVLSSLNDQAEFLLIQNQLNKGFTQNCQRMEQEIKESRWWWQQVFRQK